jgi:hypothetical protein
MTGAHKPSAAPEIARNVVGPQLWYQVRTEKMNVGSYRKKPDLPRKRGGWRRDSNAPVIAPRRVGIRIQQKYEFNHNVEIDERGYVTKKATSRCQQTLGNERLLACFTFLIDVNEQDGTKAAFLQSIFVWRLWSGQTPLPITTVFANSDVHSISTQKEHSLGSVHGICEVDRAPQYPWGQKKSLSPWILRRIPLSWFVSLGIPALSGWMQCKLYAIKCLDHIAQLFLVFRLTHKLSYPAFHAKYADRFTGNPVSLYQISQISHQHVKTVRFNKGDEFYIYPKEDISSSSDEGSNVVAETTKDLSESTYACFGEPAPPDLKP